MLHQRVPRTDTDIRITSEPSACPPDFQSKIGFRRRQRRRFACGARIEQVSLVPRPPNTTTPHLVVVRLHFFYKANGEGPVAYSNMCTSAHPQSAETNAWMESHACLNSTLQRHGDVMSFTWNPTTNQATLTSNQRRTQLRAAPKTPTNTCGAMDRQHKTRNPQSRSPHDSAQNQTVDLQTAQSIWEPSWDGRWRM